MTHPRSELNAVIMYKYKLNPVTRIGRLLSWESVRTLFYRGLWFDPTMYHYFSPVTVRLLVHAFPVGDPRSE